jgi:hypothetical protein
VSQILHLQVNGRAYTSSPLRQLEDMRNFTQEPIDALRYEVIPFSSLRGDFGAELANVVATSSPAGIVRSWFAARIAHSYQNKDIIRYCKSHMPSCTIIAVNCRDDTSAEPHPVITQIAAECESTYAGVIASWQHQKG